LELKQKVIEGIGFDGETLRYCGGGGREEGRSKELRKREGEREDLQVTSRT
jgi:hypothetical protein